MNEPINTTPEENVMGSDMSEHLPGPTRALTSNEVTRADAHSWMGQWKGSASTGHYVSAPGNWYREEDYTALWVAYQALLSERRQPVEPSAPVAYVPVHPRMGPLWSNTTSDPNPERLPNSYPLMPLYAAAPSENGSGDAT